MLSHDGHAMLAKKKKHASQRSAVPLQQVTGQVGVIALICCVLTLWKVDSLKVSLLSHLVLHLTYSHAFTQCMKVIRKSTSFCDAVSHRAKRFNAQVVWKRLIKQHKTFLYFSCVLTYLFLKDEFFVQGCFVWIASDKKVNAQNTKFSS